VRIDELKGVIDKDKGLIKISIHYTRFSATKDTIPNTGEQHENYHLESGTS
jgi:hypothetical protein